VGVNLTAEAMDTIASRILGLAQPFGAGRENIQRRGRSTASRILENSYDGFDEENDYVNVIVI
jgi:hypothetical protein